MINQAVYNLIWSAGIITGSFPALLYAIFSGERIRDRMGFIPNSSQDGIWIHGASVGESAETIVLARSIRGISDIQLLLSSQTLTGFSRLRKCCIENSVVVQAPLDFWLFVKNALKRVKPKILVLLEVELWPNYILLSARSGVKVIWANARISGRTFSFFRKFPNLYGPVRDGISRVIVRDEGDIPRFVSAGFDENKLVVLGDLKFSASIPEAFEPFAPIERYPIVVAGSIRKEELPIVLKVSRSLRASYDNPLLIVAPRYPADFEYARKFFETNGAIVHTRSRDKLPSQNTDVFILDTIGELGKIYSLADIAIIGGSWFPAGGHNPLEAVVWGVPVIAGPYVKNNKGIYDVLVSENACRIVGEDELAQSILDELSSRNLLSSARKVAREKIPEWKNIARKYAESVVSMV